MSNDKKSKLPLILSMLTVLIGAGTLVTRIPSAMLAWRRLMGEEVAAASEDAQGGAAQAGSGKSAEGKGGEAKSGAPVAKSAAPRDNLDERYRVVVGKGQGKLTFYFADAGAPEDERMQVKKLLPELWEACRSQANDMGISFGAGLKRKVLVRADEDQDRRLTLSELRLAVESGLQGLDE